MNNEKLYTVTDFANYHAGTMPPQEMHALEKAALEDPFLADALEGYVYTPTATSNIEKLQEKLKLKKGIQAPVKLIGSKTWWRVAASVISILGIGFLFYTINKKENTGTLAKNEQKNESKIDTASTSTYTSDSISMLDVTFGDNSNLETTPVTKKDISQKLDNTNTSTNPFPKRNQTNLVQFEAKDEIASTPTSVTPVIENRMDVKEKSEVEVNIAVNENDKIAGNVNDKEFLKSTANNNALNNYYNYSGIVKSPTGGPMQNATIRSRNLVKQTDQNGRFNFKATDSSLNASIAADGFNDKTVVLNTSKVPTFILDYDNKSLNEVVVTGYGNKARKKVASGKDQNLLILNKKEEYKQVTINDALTGKVAGVKVAEGKNSNWADSISINKPKIGAENDMQFFNAYVLKNSKPVLDDKDNIIKGKTVLSFTVNKKGRPRDIKIIQSLYKDCDEQAILLLQNGPKWNMKKGDRKTVTIEF